MLLIYSNMMLPKKGPTPSDQLGQDYLKEGPPGAFNGQPDSQKLKKLVKRKSVRTPW